ncbi:MAG: long-chain fatty acid--CoA ligase [Marinilabiliales bacterium]
MRIFDYIENSLVNNPDNICFARKYRGNWETLNASEYQEKTDRLAYGALKKNIGLNDNVIIISENRPEWNIIDLSMMKTGAVTVPVYPTISRSHLFSIIKETQARYIFVSGKYLLSKVNDAIKEVSHTVHIYTMDEISGYNNYTELISGESIEYIREALKNNQLDINEDDVYTILYTLGTTGEPKGVMLTHKSHLSIILDLAERAAVNSSFKSLSYLPLNHIFEKTVTYVSQINGVSVYYAEGLGNIIDNFQEVKPDFLSTVPMLLEKVYKNIVKQADGLESPIREKYIAAIEFASNYDMNKEYTDEEVNLYNEYDKMFYSKWRNILGGNLKSVLCGGAKMQKELFHLFWAAKVPLLQGYGLTETSGLISIDRLGDIIKLNKCGKKMNCLEVKLSDEGEILARGTSIMKGYYKHPELTKHAIDNEGWYHTGDLGNIDDDGYIEITGRIKSTFKNSAGKYIYPENIENFLKKSSIISDVIVAGMNKPYLVALILPNVEKLKEITGLNDIKLEELVNNGVVNDLIKKEIDKYNKDVISEYERIENFALISDTWSIETGEYTPTLKIRRNFVLDKYNTLIENLYN